MALILDAGALIAFERGVQRAVASVGLAQHAGTPIHTTSGVVAQVWRGGGRQARLALLLRGIDERSLDEHASRRIGMLLGEAGSSDVVDASIVDIAIDGDEILTSDVADITSLADAAGKRLMITPVGF